MLGLIPPKTLLFSYTRLCSPIAAMLTGTLSTRALSGDPYLVGPGPSRLRGEGRYSSRGIKHSAFPVVPVPALFLLYLSRHKFRPPAHGKTWSVRAVPAWNAIVKGVTSVLFAELQGHIRTRRIALNAARGTAERFSSREG